MGALDKIIHISFLLLSFNQFTIKIKRTSILTATDNGKH